MDVGLEQLDLVLSLIPFKLFWGVFVCLFVVVLVIALFLFLRMYCCLEHFPMSVFFPFILEIRHILIPVCTLPTGHHPYPGMSAWNSWKILCSSIQDIPGYKSGIHQTRKHVCSLESTSVGCGMVLSASSLLIHSGTKDASFSYTLKYTLLE